MLPEVVGVSSSSIAMSSSLIAGEVASFSTSEGEGSLTTVLTTLAIGKLDVASGRNLRFAASELVGRLSGIAPANRVGRDDHHLSDRVLHQIHPLGERCVCLPIDRLEQHARSQLSPEEETGSVD